MPSKVRINLLVGMVVKVLKMFSKEKSTDMYLQHPLKRWGQNPLWLTLHPWQECHRLECPAVCHLCICYASSFSLGESLNSFGFGSFLVYQSINLYHTSMTPLSRLCVLGMPCIAFLAFCSVVACRSPAFQVSCWWLCSTSQDNRLKLVTMRQCDNVLCLTISLTMSCLKSWYCRT